MGVCNSRGYSDGRIITAPVNMPQPTEKEQQAIKLLTKALQLLHEVKRYRGVFYAQKVGTLQSKFEKLKNDDTNE